MHCGNLSKQNFKGINKPITLSFNLNFNQMRKEIISKWIAIALFSFVSFSTFAQISVGAKGGLNVSSLSGVTEDNYETKAIVGFHAGAYVTFNLGRNFAIQPELVYSTQGGTIEGNGFTEDLKLNYFNIPVMVKFLTNKGFYIEAGPQLGFNTGDLDTENLESSIEGSDFSICGGIGFQPTKSPFGIGVRYNAGMGTTGEINFDDPNIDNSDFKNGVFQLSIYWRLFGGGKLKK